jgi:DNA-directed RNA polymerase specialized sigma24 family protein
MPSPSLSTPSASTLNSNFQDLREKLVFSPENFEPFWKILEPFVTKIVKSRLRTASGRNDIDDVVNDVALKIFSNCQSFDLAKGNISAWAGKLAVNVCTTWQRNLVKRQKLCNDTGYMDRCPAPGENPLDKLATSQECKKLRKAFLHVASSTQCISGNRSRVIDTALFMLEGEPDVVRLLAQQGVNPQTTRARMRQLRESFMVCLRQMENLKDPQKRYTLLSQARLKNDGTRGTKAPPTAEPPTDS